MHSPCDTTIIGLGSVLMSDDGLGPTLIHRLATAWCFEPGIDLIDVGSSAAELCECLAVSKQAILIDVITRDGAPGTLYWLGREDLLDLRPDDRLTPHEPALAATLAILGVTGQVPESLHLLGVIPASLAVGTGLSPELEHALPDCERALQARLGAAGIRMTPCTGKRVPEPWWLRESQCTS